MKNQKAIFILTLSILLFSYTIKAEESKEAKTTPDKDVEIEVLKERIKGNEEKRNIQLKKLEDEIALRANTLEKTINSKYESTKEATGFVSQVKDWGVYFAGFVALIIAIWGKYLRSLRSYPKLKLCFDKDSTSDVCKMPTYYRKGAIKKDAYYFRFRVKNDGNITAKKVEVFVNKISEEQADGKYKLQTGFIPLNLTWSHNINIIYFPQIPPDMERHCELGNIADPDLRKQMPEYAPDSTIGDSTTLFSIAFKIKSTLVETHRLVPRKYKFQLLITASNVKKPKTYEFIIEHKGKWFKDKKDMLQEGIDIKLKSA